MKSISTAERQARLATRHLLAPGHRVGAVADVADGIVALHGTDPASVYLAAAARLRDGTAADVESALYDQRALLRMLGMRRTVFAVRRELIPVVQHACTAAVAVRQRAQLLALLTDAGIESPEAWLRETEAETLQAIHAAGAATGAQLSKLVPRLRTSVVVAAGSRNEATQNVSSRVLLVLGAEGRIARGRPRGSWISSQFQWSLIDDWLPGGIPELSTEDAQTELARQWLARYGPGTAADLKWWTGWTATQAKKAIARLGAVEVDLGGKPGFVLPDDLDPVAEPEPWAALLPGLDPTPMGWVERDWYLGDHAAELFDRTGNIGPTVWWNGRIVGGWAQRPDGEIAVGMLERTGRAADKAIIEATARLRDWLADTRVTPRFRTPLERKLSV